MERWAGARRRRRRRGRARAATAPARWAPACRDCSTSVRSNLCAIIARPEDTSWPGRRRRRSRRAAEPPAGVDRDPVRRAPGALRSRAARPSPPFVIHSSHNCGSTAASSSGRVWPCWASSPWSPCSRRCRAGWAPPGRACSVKGSAGASTSCRWWSPPRAPGSPWAGWDRASRGRSRNTSSAVCSCMSPF